MSGRVDGGGGAPSVLPTAGRRGSGPAVDGCAIRRRRSTAASNARNRSVASSEPVGAGVVTTRVANREQSRVSSPPTWPHAQSEGRGVRSRRTCRERYGKVQAARLSRRSARRARSPRPRTSLVGELGEQRRLAHPRLTAHHHAPEARLSHQASSVRSTSCSLERPTNATRCAKAAGSGTSIASVDAGISRSASTPFHPVATRRSTRTTSRRARSRTLRPAAIDRSGKLGGRRPGDQPARGPDQQAS